MLGLLLRQWSDAVPGHFSEMTKELDQIGNQMINGVMGCKKKKKKKSKK